MRHKAIWVGSVLVVVALLYWPDTATLVRYWLREDLNAQSGVLIVLLSGFLLFRARARFDEVAIRPVPWAGLLLIACAAASLICWRAGIQTLQLFFLPPILWLALLTVLGPQIARSAAVAIGLLYFALPGWDLFQPTLQHLTAWAVGVIGPAVGLPVVVSGMTASLPGRVAFAIEPACSGADFLTVGLAVATWHGELERASFRRRAGLIGGMAVLAILSNWLRVILIIAIGYLSQMRSALATRDHLAFGWVIFACALVVFVWIAGRVRSNAPAAAVLGSPPGDAMSRATVSQGRAPLRYGIVATALLAVPTLVYVSLLVSDQAEASAATALDLPPVRIPWHGLADSADSLWQPRFVGASTAQRTRYQRADGRIVEVVAIGFAKQTQGAKILKEGNSLLGNRGLSIEAIAFVQSGDVPHGEVITLDPDGRRSLIWSVFDIGGRLFGEPLYSQLWYGARSLIGTPYSALFALRTQCDSSCDPAREVLDDFLRANGPTLFASLPDSNRKGQARSR